MIEENPKVKLLNVKDSIENARLVPLKFALKKQNSIELQEERKKGNENLFNIIKRQEALATSEQGSMKKNILKNLAKGKHEFAKDKVGNSLVEHEAMVMVMVKDELKDDGNNHQQPSTLQCIAGMLNGKEQGKSKEMHKMNGGKDYGGVRDLIKMKDEIKDLDKGREKGKNLVVKSTFLKIQQQLVNNASKIRPKSTNYLRKKKLMQTKTMATTTMKIVMEQRKEKRVYFLPGQKHDPPEDRDPLRIFYSTLRAQMPESGMAEFWLMENGLLPQDQAKKALERKQKRGQPLKCGILSKSSVPLQLSNGPLKNLTPIFNDKGKNKKVDSESDSNDFLHNIRIKKKLKA